MMDNLNLTIFRNKYDNKTDKVMSLTGFTDFENLLYQLSEVKREGKHDSYLISPACYAEGTNRRCNDNVTGWSTWAAMDVDEHNFSTENLQDELYNWFGNFNYVCYSTASSSRTLPKFRMVFPISRPIEGTRVHHFWYALNRELGGLGDPQTKDLSRMYYIPATYTGAYNFIFSNHSGVAIDPDVLMGKHPFDERLMGSGSGSSFIDRLPKEMREQVIGYRKMTASVSGANVRWSGYSDCPFVNQSLISEYKSVAHIDNSGRYAMMYKIMVSIATSAVRNNYPITANEIVSLIRELDQDTSNRYKRRRLDIEADRAIEFAYRNM